MHPVNAAGLIVEIRESIIQAQTPAPPQPARRGEPAVRDTLHRREFLEQSSCAVVGFGAAMLGAPRAAAAEPIEKPRPLFTVRDSHLRDSGAKNCWTAMDVSGGRWGRSGHHGRPGPAGALPPGKEVLAGHGGGTSRRSAPTSRRRASESPPCACTTASRSGPKSRSKWRTKVARRPQAWACRRSASTSCRRKLAQARVPRVRRRHAQEGHGRHRVDRRGLRHREPRHDDQRPGVPHSRCSSGVGSKRLGLTLDTGNFYWFGHPLSKVYELYETFAPRVFHTHCKSIRYPEAEREKQRPIGWEYGKYDCPIYEGDIDFRRVVKILSAAGYANDLCVEDESLGKSPAAERRAILAKEIRHLKEAAEA